jgi:hypothetical protein
MAAQFDTQYEAESVRIAAESSIAMMAFANDDLTDCEFVALKPRMMTPDQEAAFRDAWAGRGLSVLGVVGLVGATPRCAFKRPLGPAQVDALAAGFLAYIHALIASAFPTERAKGDDEWSAFASRLFELPDSRSN